jgi:hypothetical protein
VSDERYVRVYYRILDDPKFEHVYPNDARLATWVRLLMVADNAWPHPAQVPRNVDPDALAFLVAVGLIDSLPNDLYRVHGMDAERMKRREQGLAGGIARAAAATRSGGRFTSERWSAIADERTVTSVSPASRSSNRSRSRSTRATTANETTRNDLDTCPSCGDLLNDKDDNVVVVPYPTGQLAHRTCPEDGVVAVPS